MGSVYEVEHVELGKRFVLKALFRELAGRKDLVARLRNEWRALGRLDHPNIINVTDAGTADSGVHFYVMERVEGETLADRMRRERRLPPREAVRITRAVLEGLGAAHDIGIVHRDIKPPNIFLLQGGGVKILDFGIAKLMDSGVEVITARGMAIGTPRYMSPEQARGESVDGRADLYAVGLTLYEMLTGEGPFDDVEEAAELLLAHLTRPAPRVSERAAAVGRELDDLVQSLLRKQPKERPGSARQVAKILEGLSRLTHTVSTDAPTPAANYHAVTQQAAAPKVLHTAPLQTPGTPASTVREGAGGFALGNAATVAAEGRPASTLILRPSGETAAVSTVRDQNPQFEELEATDATLPTEGLMDAPWSAPASVDRTLAEAVPLSAPPSSNPERTQELSELDVQQPPLPTADLPTRTSVPVGTVVSLGSAETPPPVESPARSQQGGVRRPPWALLGIAAAVVAVVGVVGVGVLLRAAKTEVPDPAAAAAPAAEPGAPPAEETPAAAKQEVEKEPAKELVPEPPPSATAAIAPAQSARSPAAGSKPAKIKAIEESKGNSEPAKEAAKKPTPAPEKPVPSKPAPAPAVHKRPVLPSSGL